MKRPAFAAGLFLAALFLLAACDDDGSTPPDPTATAEGIAPPGQTATPIAPAATETPVAFEGGRDPVDVPFGGASTTPLLADVRTGLHQGFDRVVFEYDGGLPGYHVEYVSSPIAQCGSGMEEAVVGNAFLEVRMTPAAAHDDAGTPTFGPQELLPGLPSILEVQSICDFEGQVTWVLGLTEQADFNVVNLTGPFRVVVDVAHP
ncbi:MAG: hypothetical protein IH958_01305 [Chloroflexi bacterium]|nr:hypothetical protein [Chloroflexota bacterium]